MSVSKEVQEFINNSLAQNNRALLDHISKLVAADDQLREIKKLRREEPKVFKRKGNTNSIPSFRIRWMMSNCISRPTHSTRLNRPCQKVHVIAHRKAKAIPFSMHINQISVGRPLRNIPSMNLLMMRRMAKRFDGQRKEPRKPWSPRLPRRLLSVLPRPLVVRLHPSPMQNFRSYSSFGFSPNQSDRLSLLRVPGLPSRCSNCFACGKFGHWRSECLQVSRSAISGSKGFSGNKWVVVDDKSKFHISFVNPLCDVVEVVSEDSVHEPRKFELEAAGFEPCP